MKMKRPFLIGRLVAVLLVLAGCIVGLHPTTPVAIVYAQSVPAVVHAQWAPNPASDNVTSYVVVVDSDAPITVAPTVDATCACVQAPITLNAFGNHTVTFKAVNQMLSTDPASAQTSAPTVVSFALNKPASTVTGAAVKK
jgi:hypothetical protein